MNLPRLEDVAPMTIAVLALLALGFSHWLQMPEQALTAMVGVLGGAVTLYFVNRAKTQP